MQLTKESAENKMAAMNMSDLPLIQHQATPHPVAQDWFPKYKELRRQFMMSLTDSVEDLAFMNLGQEEFMALVMGRRLPANTSIRFRVPLVWGGALDMDNLFLCWTFPHSHNMDRFIIEQAGAETLWLPNPTRKIYIPAHTTGGGDGGNTTEDRLSQMAAQIAAGRGME